MTSSKINPVWILVLLVVLAGGWLWYNQSTTTMTVVGEATVKAAPDQYLFYPTYEAKDADKEQARDEVTKTGNEVVAKLKELGVAESMLTTNVTVNENYDYRIMPAPNSPDGYVATYSMTITLEDFELAKTVQEELATTPVTGAVTPTSTFQDATQKKLEREARKLALEDAKAQATEDAETIGVRVLGIKSIGQPSWGGPIYPLGLGADAVSSSAVAEKSIAVPELLVGEQEVSYSIEVVYRVR